MNTLRKIDIRWEKTVFSHLLRLAAGRWIEKRTIVLVIAFACLTGCDSPKTPEMTPDVKPAVVAEVPQPNESPHAEQVNDEPEVDSACGGEATFGIPLSKDACQISQLLDRKAFVAAETLLDKQLPYSSSDAGLYCQYVRLLIEREPIVEGFIRSPILTDDKYRIDVIINRAATLAVEFDPETKSYLSNIILSGIYSQLKKKADVGDGYIYSAYEITGGWNYNKVNSAWKAIELDPILAQIWEPKFTELVPKFVRSGRSSSAMWTANLAGDLKTGADPKSDIDFDLATRAFLDALNSNKVTKETMDDTSKAYTGIFKTEVQRSLSTANSMGQKLVMALESRNADTSMYEQLGTDVEKQ